MRQLGCARMTISAVKIFMDAMRQRFGLYSDEFSVRVCQARRRLMTRKAIV
jgi:hypothetical protein